MRGDGSKCNESERNIPYSVSARHAEVPEPKMLP